jgi:hypothetical protein
MGLRGSSLRLVFQSIMAGCAGLSSTDVSIDFGDAGMGIFMADLPRSRNWQAGL